VLGLLLAARSQRSVLVIREVRQPCSVASVGLVAMMRVFPGGMVMHLSARSAIRWSLSAVHDFRALTQMVTPRSKALSCIGGSAEHPVRVCRDNLAADLRLCLFVCALEGIRTPNLLIRSYSARSAVQACVGAGRQRAKNEQLDGVGRCRSAMWSDGRMPVTVLRIVRDPRLGTTFVAAGI
jgi:hypothetical protein